MGGFLVFVSLAGMPAAQQPQPLLCAFSLSRSLSSAITHTACSCRNAHQISLLLQAEKRTSHNWFPSLSRLSSAMKSLSPIISALSSSHLLWFVPTCQPSDVSMPGSLSHVCVLSREYFVELQLLKLFKEKNLERECQTHFHQGPHQPHSCLQRAKCNFRTV